MRILAVWMRSSSRGVALLPCDAASEPAAAGAEVMIGAFLGPFQNLTRRAKRRPATGASSMQSRMAVLCWVAAAALQQCNQRRTAAAALQPRNERAVQKHEWRTATQPQVCSKCYMSAARSFSLQFCHNTTGPLRCCAAGNAAEAQS